MVIETERLLLREYVPDDFDARFEILAGLRDHASGTGGPYPAGSAGMIH